MHRSLTLALAASLWFALAFGTTLISRAGDVSSAVDEAQSRLTRGDARGAVEILESALPGANNSERPALLNALSAAYPVAARQADSQGKATEAESYRDNLEILSRKPRTAAPSPPPAPKRLAREPKEKAAKTDSDVNPVALAPADPAGVVAALPAVAPLDSPPALAAPDAPPATMPLATNTADPVAPAPRPETVERRPPPHLVSTPTPVLDKSTIKAAVEAFKAEKYDEAGTLFAALYRDGKLPPNLRSHWAYCRAVEVVRRLNARPASPQEWAAIDAEIQNIRTLSPSNWFAEYLRNLASERNRDGRSRSARSNKVVLRGSSPDEPSLPAASAPPAPSPASAAIAWSRQPVESANFVVIHVEKDRPLAEQAARSAEATRESQIKRWGGASEAWSPRCEVVLFPTAADFARETLQPADSPGFSTMGMNSGKIVLRRVHLRSDHPNMLKAILPHEVAHVVLADLFPSQQIPRWADEGMAVLAEPHSEQSVRAADLDEPLRSGRVFRVGDLMTMDSYPRPEYWGLYYSQSVSLTRYLVETGSPAQFVRFVQQSQQTGVEPALKQVYSISGFGDLQNRWLSYAREKSSATAAITASADRDKNPGTPRQ